MRPAFVFSPDRCTGCEACRVACGIENGDGRDTGWRQVTTFNPARHPSLPTRHLSLACNHCEKPACALGCPAKAYRRDEATGAMLIDEAKCIGCRYCSWVCPYDAPRFDAGAGVMTKCTFCSHRLVAGRDPACTVACPTGALALGRTDGRGEEPAMEGLGTFGLLPALQVVPPRRNAPPDGVDEEDAGEPLPFPRLPERKITFGSEWGLWLFTLVFPALVGWFAGGLRHSERAPALLFFLAPGLLATGLSTIHLGKPLRAWRAVLNFRTSWLSREALLAPLFLLLGLPYVGLVHASPQLGFPALVAGLLLCVSIDGVYRAVARSGEGTGHSSEATPTALLYAGLVGGMPWLALVAGALKTVRLVSGMRERRGQVPALVLLARFGLLAMALAPGLTWTLAFPLAFLGEVIDRALFYAGLEPSTPATRMAAEAEVRLSAVP